MKQRFLSIAKKSSRRSDHPQYQMGCVIAKGNKILGTGYNVYRTHPKSPHEFKFIHAEFMASLNAGANIEGSTVYVFREQKDGTLAIAKPCHSCWKYLMDLGVKEVVYSFEGSFKKEAIA